MWLISLAVFALVHARPDPVGMPNTKPVPGTLSTPSEQLPIVNVQQALVFWGRPNLRVTPFFIEGTNETVWNIVTESLECSLLKLTYEQVSVAELEWETYFDLSLWQINGKSILCGTQPLDSNPNIRPCQLVQSSRRLIC
jgi:hypothetical protein